MRWNFPTRLKFVKIVFSDALGLPSSTHEIGEMFPFVSAAFSSVHENRKIPPFVSVTLSSGSNNQRKLPFRTKQALFISRNSLICGIQFCKQFLCSCNEEKVNSIERAVHELLCYKRMKRSIVYGTQGLTMRGLNFMICRNNRKKQGIQHTLY